MFLRFIRFLGWDLRFLAGGAEWPAGSLRPLSQAGYLAGQPTSETASHSQSEISPPTEVKAKPTGNPNPAEIQPKSNQIESESSRNQIKIKIQTKAKSRIDPKCLQKV